MTQRGIDVKKHFAGVGGEINNPWVTKGLVDNPHRRDKNQGQERYCWTTWEKIKRERESNRRSEKKRRKA